MNIFKSYGSFHNLGTLHYAWFERRHMASMRSELVMVIAKQDHAMRTWLQV